MNRRSFLKVSSAGMLLGVTIKEKAYAGFMDILTTGNPQPTRAITAAVDTVLPKDPEVEDDFQASDYGADRYLASQLGWMGQIAFVMYLNKYSRRVARKTFVNCSPEERTKAISTWVREKESCPKMEQELLVGLVSLTTIGTFEGLSAEDQAVLYAKMGWFDPEKPTETFRIPCDGYSNLS